MYDFWSMVYQNTLDCRSRLRDPDPEQNVQKVVMLTNFIENNRQKCEKYFPLELNDELLVDSGED
ncbi:tyrosine-protein phosphatase, partial [Pseudomonas aeruginosa]